MVHGNGSLHLDVLRDMKRINSHIAAAAYPVLERQGELLPSRLRSDVDTDELRVPSSEGQYSADGRGGGRTLMQLPRMPAAVIFDMDGLLFDTETLYQEAIVLAAAEGGHEVADDVFNRTVGLPWAQSRALPHFGEAFPVDEFQEAWVRHFWAIAEDHLGVKPGALELLDTLDQLKLLRAIATSSSHRTVERHLTAHQLTGRFDAIVGHG